MSSLPRRIVLQLSVVALALVACGPAETGDVNNEASARLAYLGLDAAVGRAIQLGFDGFNAASNANIPEQSEAGDLGGMMVVGGQVDAGASNNKGMRLQVTLKDDYADVVLEGDRMVIYNGGPAALDMNFKGLPDADLTGTMMGTFVMAGDLAGDVTLNVSIVGKTMAGPGGEIVRVPGTVVVTGTATSGYGTFNIDVKL
jgi:hypothetical protein